ncbi:hypothetical protein CHS0354_041194 [Potamilus streckersoni]|uniref:Phospholipid/glycerol acyltransferase domain-containing protein n=1 Tax=Potamilus streckersoni TaxID=2493646 RepID=A0AAE0SE29_9BIVA|nr:hypothetical protein CHS0354_041194 [Potamilus streckersoni]
MPGVVSVLPDLENVYAKWEKKGPRGHNSSDYGSQVNGKEIDRKGADGKQKWRNKYGDNLQLGRHRGTREKRVNTIPVDTVRNSTIAMFKTTPTVVPEDFMKTRPLMGKCSILLPNSQKDLSAPNNLGMRNILDVSHEMRGHSPLIQRFCYLAYSLSRKTTHKYTDVSMAVLTSQRVIDAVQEAVSKEKQNVVSDLKKRARKILKGMKASVSNYLIRFTGWFLFQFLGRILNTVQVHKSQMQITKTASERCIPIIYLPLHKSHLDYILVTWILWHYEIRIPFVAAGDNLRISLFGRLMSGLGAYFIRRKLDMEVGKKDKIYRSVLHSYMEELLRAGEAMEFFIEGSRSRSGKALPPKGGLMSVVLDSLNAGVIEDAYIVPISISYEVLLEGNFNNEQMGVPKVKETFWGALKGIWRVINSNFGSVRVDFAQPFSLKEFVQICQSASQARRDSDVSPPTTPVASTETLHRISESNAAIYGTSVVEEEQRQLVKRLGEHVVHTCVRTTALMCTNLLSFLLLTKYRKGVDLEILKTDYKWLIEEVMARKRDVGFSSTSKISDVLHYALSHLGSNHVQKRTTEGVVMIYPNLQLPDIFELSYNSNQVISVFYLESILVNAVIFLSDLSLINLNSLNSRDVGLVSRDEILQVAEQLCHLLKYEFIPASPLMKLEEVLADTMDQLVTMEILSVEENEQFSPSFNTYDRNWAKRISASLSWADEEDPDDIYREEQLLKVNIHRSDCIDKLVFFHRILAPFFESYLVAASHISTSLEEEMSEEDFIQSLHNCAKERVEKGVASYSESAALDTLRNALKSFEYLKIVDTCFAGNLRIIGLYDDFNVKDKLTQYITLLESLRE